MKAAQSIWIPVRFTSSWQTTREKEHFAEQQKKALRLERRCIKAGLTMSGQPRQHIIGDIEYEARFYSHKPTMDQFADAVLNGLKEGRITL